MRQKMKDEKKKSSKLSSGSSKIDTKEIMKLIDLLEERNLSHFELEAEGIKIKISRDQSPVSPGAEAEPNQDNTPPQATEAEFQENHDNVHYVTSPMVGTFFRAPDPNSPPFVDIGETVKKNQTLCIIEAMKLMNEIESDIDGILQEIYVENGKPVEYGQKLFSIQKPS